MGRTWNRTLAISGLAAALAACEPAAEYRAALPSEDTVTVHLPGDSNRGSLSSTRSSLVGEKSDFHAKTYATARDLNLLGRAVVELVQGIASFPPTKLGEGRAVWGPFSDAGDPNEYLMTVERIELGERYDWRIEGKHKADGSFTLLAGGTFEPEDDDFGRGWFELDFDAVRTLDPREGAKGRAAYAFEKTKEGLSVRLRFAGPNDDGEEIEAGYAFERAPDGSGSILFAFPGDIEENGSLDEDILIRTRWTAGGTGRADVVAQNGDLDTRIGQASQCWDERFISRYEVLKIDGTIESEEGDEKACVLEEAMLPSDAELPEETDVQNPYQR